MSQFKAYNNNTKALSTDLIKALKTSIEESAKYLLFEEEEIISFAIPTALTEDMLRRNTEYIPYEIIKAFDKGYHITKPGGCPEGCCVLEFENPNDYELAIVYGFKSGKFKIHSINQRRTLLSDIFE